jgi:hypothetical protein
MARFNFVIYSNPAPGREAEYNDWYDNIHLKEVGAIPGVKSARRMKLSEQQLFDAARKYRYAAIYEIEAADIKDFIGEMAARSKDGRLQQSGAIDRDALPVFWQVL